MHVDPVTSLEREWQHQLADGALRARLPAWAEQEPALAPFGSAAQLIRFLNSAPPRQTDGPMLALLCVARGERLAGRVLLQAILPALKSQAERITCEPGRREEVWELLLFFAWEAICCYPTRRRRCRVAANLVLQVLHDTTRELRRTTPQPTAVSPRSRTLTCAQRGVRAADVDAAPRPDATQTTAVTELGAEALVMTAVAAGLIPERDAQLILQTRVDGIRLRLIARAQGIRQDALRKRRQRAEATLRRTLPTRPDVRKTPDPDLTSTEQPASPRRRSSRTTAQPDAAARNAA